MPAELSAYSRRLSRRLNSDDDIDIRRARGEISCAECRRLKLKCDKKIPCGSCTRRGCYSICPNGLSSGQGTRHNLTDTSQLQAKIAGMGIRMRQLENALAIFQSSVSNETHPLLREELLVTTSVSEKSTPDKEDAEDDTAHTIDALGILTIGDRGAKYYGPSAGAETGAEMDMSALEHDQTPRVSAEITGLSRFPFAIEESTGVTLELILNHLPPQPRAWSLYETYMEHASWIFQPLRREEMIDEILSPVYKAMKDKQTNSPSAIESISPHKLAVLFLIFTLGALVDLTLDPYNTESETYYHLSCACLSLRSIFDSPEIATVQAVVLMAACHAEGGRKHTMDSAWALMSVGAKLAQSVNRDGARFGMDAKTVERRRWLFWELFSSDTFYSLSLGRPPSICLSYVDCQFPEDDLATTDENGNIRIGFHRWKYEFMRDVFSATAVLNLQAKAPQYQAVLELDRKLLNKTLPPYLNDFFGSEQCSPLVYMRKCLLWHFRASNVMYIHRSFFVQAMLDHPEDPLRSGYAPSFLAAYRSASAVIKAIIVGCIVTQSPSSSVAPNAFIEFGLVCDLFEKGATHSRRARDGLAVLCKLKEKAYEVYSRYRTGNPPSNDTLAAGKPDELALFGGQTRVIVSKLLSRGSPKKSHSQSASPKPSAKRGSDSDPTTFPAEQIQDVPPALREYLSMFPIDNSSNTSQPLDFDHQNDIAMLSTLQGYPVQDHNMEVCWQPLPSSTFTTTPPPNYSTPDDPSFTAPFMPFMPQSEFETTRSKTDFHKGNFFDLGRMMSDGQWASFVPELNAPGSYTYGESRPSV
ncbi:hypothetical protein L208DRAFT_1420701 [Tricholoma matsutake]|nr:hypothetical protein L208DRAFT_1420701 [Tricholoma matsutake 945]